MAGETILAVDDSPSVLMFAAFALGQVGYRVETTNETWIAGLVQKLRPQLILMDVNLGTAMTGPMVVRGLNKLAIRKYMTLLLYSSLPKEQMEGLVDACQADGYIRKGCTAKELQRAVTRVLEPQTGRRNKHPARRLGGCFWAPVGSSPAPATA